MKRLVLVKPSLEYKTQIIDMLDEWSEYNKTHTTDPSPRVIFNNYQDFESYIKMFEEQETNPKPGLVPASTYFALDKDRNIIVGAVQIRHYLNETLKRYGGHIGDGIRPSERRKGYATEMIGLALHKCKELGIDQVMVSCNKTNIGSKKSILNNHGVYEHDVEEEGEIFEVYWINL